MELLPQDMGDAFAQEIRGTCQLSGLTSLGKYSANQNEKAVVVTPAEKAQKCAILEWHEFGGLFFLTSPRPAGSVSAHSTGNSRRPRSPCFQPTLPQRHLNPI